MWPDTFGLACCAIEMMSIVSARYDIARFGMEAFRSSPRQADLLIVSGRVAHKMAAPLRQIYDQMLEPKWVIAMGACASSGGMFNNYAILQGVDKIVPVDIYVPGCPPRPEALMEGIIRLHETVKAGVPPAYEHPRSRRSDATRALPGLVETREAHGETTLVVEPARLRRGVHAPARRARLQLPLGHRRDRLPRLGRQGRRRLHRHRRAAATSTRPTAQGLATLPDPKPKRFSISYHLLALAPGAPPRARSGAGSTRRARAERRSTSGRPRTGTSARQYDLMGIGFEGHPNLRRILMEDDWEGHPLRKDYPIGGEPVRFSEAE